MDRRLHIPGNSIEQQLKVTTCRFRDGREVALAEFPLSQQLSNGQTVRAEEIVLSVPDGRNVAMLVNATPIRGEDGGIVSVVVTMQDLPWNKWRQPSGRLVVPLASTTCRSGAS